MIRELMFCDISVCRDILNENWGPDVAERGAIQLREAFGTSPYSPLFYVYEHNNQVVGFAGMQPSMIMTDFYDFIWINIKKDYWRQDIGTQLTKHRINVVRENGGKVIQLVTQKYTFFRRFGFQNVNVYQSAGNDAPWCHMILQINDLTMKQGVQNEPQDGQ